MEDVGYIVPGVGMEASHMEGGVECVVRGGVHEKKITWDRHSIGDFFLIVFPNAHFPLRFPTRKKMVLLRQQN